ncbi:hypothetical protein VFPPC_17510 [Pochonia chlamydosporia 170]|uniref:Uncharacterized protein n=1 Tax=Pochonia chlamydosporia 170 TaxID=1380566 RepID=A0A219ARC1_METCM|nr:hypothetical protein VFPPC_17510 [Pochonia chlamydosporia 170]OWT43327.1 hypothetical protein VFPPC_17510 [Pochonia chlamydosporia 170]
MAGHFPQFEATAMRWTGRKELISSHKLALKQCGVGVAFRFAPSGYPAWGSWVASDIKTRVGDSRDAFVQDMTVQTVYSSHEFIHPSQCIVKAGEFNKKGFAK